MDTARVVNLTDLMERSRLGPRKLAVFLLLEATERAAVGAAAHPLGRLCAALLADEDGFRLFHAAY